MAIALLVLAVGTLGLVGLQLSAKRTGFEAVQRSAAAAVVMDLFERMRANRSVLPAYRVAALGEVIGARLPEPLTRCDRVSCSPADLAFYDLWQWQRSLDGEATSAAAGGLSQPVGCVEVDGRRVQVEISWQGRTETAAGIVQADCGQTGALPGAGGRHRLRMHSWIAPE